MSISSALLLVGLILWVPITCHLLTLLSPSADPICFAEIHGCCDWHPDHRVQGHCDSAHLQDCLHYSCKGTTCNSLFFSLLLLPTRIPVIMLSCLVGGINRLPLFAEHPNPFCFSLIGWQLVGTVLLFLLGWSSPIYWFSFSNWQEIGRSLDWRSPIPFPYIPHSKFQLLDWTTGSRSPYPSTLAFEPHSEPLHSPSSQNTFSNSGFVKPPAGLESGESAYPKHKMQPLRFSQFVSKIYMSFAFDSSIHAFIQ